MNHVSTAADLRRPAGANLPNLLSAYRLLVTPVVLGAIFAGHRSAFFTLICVSLATDVLDGWIARRFKLETEFGARLDSLADVATYLTTFLGLVLLEREFVGAHYVAFALLLSFDLAPQAVCLWRFGRPVSLHLYSSKITGYLQGAFVFGYFLVGYHAAYFYFMVTFSLLAHTEALLVVLILPRFRSNVRGLYWVLAERRAQS